MLARVFLLKVVPVEQLTVESFFTVRKHVPYQDVDSFYCVFSSISIVVRKRNLCKMGT